MKKNSTEFKEMQRERIFRVKPWLKSTGAKTSKGKEKSKMNALKISTELHTLIQEMNYIMKQQKEMQQMINRQLF